jgi:RNA polymerase sigma factor (sigma-70 family)
MPKQSDQPDVLAPPPAPPPDPIALVREAIGASFRGLRRPTAAILLNSGDAFLPGQLEHRVDEVLQEACLRVLERAAEFDPARRMAPWLMTFVNVVIREQRGRRIRRRNKAPVQLPESNWNVMEDALIDENLTTPAACAEKKEEVAKLRRAMALLTPEQQAAIDERYFQGLEGAALAKHLDAPSSGSARVRVHRALRALKEQFESLVSQEVGK